MDTDAHSDLPLVELLNRVLHTATSIPWPERRDLVARAVSLLRSSNEGMTAAKILTALAKDAKWEVRKAVADQFLHLPEGLYDQLVPLLANDPNTFVADSVRREMGRRSIQSAGEKRRQTKPVKRLSDEIEARFGADGLCLAMKLAEKKTEQVIRTAVHDIKGILTPIKPSLDGLRDTAADRVGKRRIERVIGGVGYLERMLADMRQWSDEIELTLTDEDVVEIVETAAQDAVDHLVAQGRPCHSVTFALNATARPRLRVSRPQLQMALTNLIKNGIEAHAVSNAEFSAGTVTASVELNDSTVRIEVADTGSGMSARDLEKLMEFVPGNTSKKHLGTGYGIPIAKRYLEAHGGRLMMTSVEDQGSRVVIVLPFNPNAGGQA